MQATQTTKEALLHAATELFAEHGYEGASIRQISERADANVAAVHYHFGSKESLYVEVFARVCRKEAHEPVARYLETHEGPASLDDVREVIRLSITMFLNELTQSPTAALSRRILMRSLLESNLPALESRLDDTFRNDVGDWEELARRAVPDLSDRDATLWAYSYMGQGALYFLAHEHVLRHLGLDAFDESFIEDASTFIADSMVAALTTAANR